MPSRLTIDSPVGPLSLAASGSALTHLLFGTSGAELPEACPADSRENAVLEAARAQLEEYFRGTRVSFDLELAPHGTDFQRTVWATLRQIPYGITVSYAEIARRIRKPAAVRAVGAANGRNPIAIIVPCHRVIGADGSLTGFGGGLATKARLLEHEGALAQKSLL
jgi:methylated-DNA-[protein]-cysteine S-methyltransferase